MNLKPSTVKKIKVRLAEIERLIREDLGDSLTYVGSNVRLVVHEPSQTFHLEIEVTGTGNLPGSTEVKALKKRGAELGLIYFNKIKGYPAIEARVEFQEWIGAWTLEGKDDQGLGVTGVAIARQGQALKAGVQWLEAQLNLHGLLPESAGKDS